MAPNMETFYAVLDVAHKRLIHKVATTRNGGKRRGPVITFPNYSMAALAAEQATVRTGRAFLVQDYTPCVKPSPSRSSSPSLLSSRSFPPSSGILPASTPAP